MSTISLQSLVTTNALFVYEGDILSLDTGDSLISAANTKIFYRRPDGTSGAWTAVKNGTKLEYRLALADINQSGEWNFQAYYEIPGSSTNFPIFGEIVSLPVASALYYTLLPP